MTERPIAAWTVDERTGVVVESALRLRMEKWSRDRIAKVIRQGRVLCDGKPARAGQRLLRGQRIEVRPAVARPRVYLPNRNVQVQFVHRDACLAVINKPSGLPVHPGPGHGSRTLLSGLLAHFQDELEELGTPHGWGLMHRLDLDASGLMVVARSREAYWSLRRQFTARTIGKRYLTLLSGVPSFDEVTVDSPVQEKLAESRFRVLDRFEHCALIEVELVTGRKHQIRWHAASIGHPVVGDERYGPRRDAEHPLRRIDLRRMFLHAAKLSFNHPATLERMHFEVNLPRDLWRPLVRLRRERGA